VTNWHEPVASPAKKETDDGSDIDRELDEWLDKEAAAAGFDPEQRQREVETWERWRANPNPDDFEFLYQSHQSSLRPALARFKTNLPPAYIRSRVLNNYIHALETFDPSKSQLHSYVRNMADRHIGRDIVKYTNIGRIPHERAGLVGLMLNAQAALEEQLGRPPSDVELSDEMKVRRELFPQIREERVNPKAVGTLREELRADRIIEGAESEQYTPGYGPTSFIEQQAVFLHGSLNPEQQLVLEHTYPGFGKPVIEDTDELAQTLKLSPQKIRAVKMQIAKKLKKYW
jgi:DNA-directed RNA polymerase specialized sigma subunit